MKKIIKITESELHQIIKESIKQIVNEVGDTVRGQYMLGRLAAKKNADRSYVHYHYPTANGLWGPEQVRKQKVMSIGDYADKHGDDSFLQHHAYVKGYDNYNADNSIGNVKANYNRYKKQDKIPIFRAIGELNAKIETIYNRAITKRADFRISFDVFDNLYDTAKEINNYFNNEHSATVMNTLKQIIEDGSFDTSHLVSMMEALEELEKMTD